MENMFASLKLNSLKCQSSSESERKKDKCDADVDDDVSEHMYEKLQSDNHSCKCQSHQNSTSPRSHKSPITKRISKWRMECPRITNLRVSRTSQDQDAKNNHEDSSRELFNSKLQGSVRTKVTTVNVQREDGNLGITLRGGFHQTADMSKPVTITYVMPDGPAAKEGTIKPGDRLLAVDGVSLKGSSLSEAQALLKQQSASTLLTVEYDVNVLDTVEYANGPLLVEIERTSAQELGLTLYQNEDGIVIERVKPGSLADRCGALHVGDEILAVNNVRFDSLPVALEEVVKLLECECPVLRLEILPSYAVVSYSNFGTWRNRDHATSPTSSMSRVSTIKSQASRVNRECENNGVSHEENSCEGFKKNLLNSNGFYGSNVALTHCETLSTTIHRENETFGIEFVDSHNGQVLISAVAPGGPAERCQCLHPGDRVIAINHKSVALDQLSAKDITEMLTNASNNAFNLVLHTEFDVLDSVVPTTGIFNVKLAKRGSSGLGITITASKTAGFMVCEMKKGSIAYRAGSLLPGDKLLAINNIPLDQCSVEYAAHILHQGTNVVTLKVQRNEAHSDVRSNRKVTYTVELQRYGGPLGITIAGSEEPFQPITISGLTSGGLAEQTGVLHIGDEILAINNYSLYGEPLSKAHSLLQSSSDLVTLKISRSILPFCRAPDNRSPVLPSSIDSAVESWDSSHMDPTPSPDHQKNIRDARDCLKQKISTSQQWSPCEPIYADVKKPPKIDNSSDLAILDEISTENLKIKQELDMLSIKLDEQCKTNYETESRPIIDSIYDAELNQNHVSVTPFNLDTNENVAAACEHCNEPQKSSDSDYVNMKPVATIQEYETCTGNRESFMTNDLENFDLSYLPEARNWFKSQYLGNESCQGSIRSEFHSSQLYKVTLYKDPIYEDFGFSVSDGLYERGVFINRIRKGGSADLSNVLKPFDRILQVNDTYTQDFDCCLTVPLIAAAGDTLELLVARNTNKYTPENGVFENEKSDSKGMMISSKVGLDDNERDEPQRLLV